MIGAAPVDGVRMSASLDPRLDRILRLLVPGWSERLDGALWRLFFARTVNTFAFSFTFPFLATYLAHERGLSATATGAVFMAQGIVGALAQVPGGVVADSLGRRATLVLSLSLRACAMAALGALVHLQAPVGAITALVLLNAIVTGLFQPAADALVVEIAAPDRRIAAFAHQRVAINIGWVAGPAFGGLMADGGRFADSFLWGAPLMLGSVWLVAGLSAAKAGARENSVPPVARSPLLADRGLLLQLAGALCTFTLAGQMVVTLSVDTAERLQMDRGRLGVLWSLNGILVVLAQMHVARLVQRTGARAALIAGSLVYGAAYAAVGFAASWPQLVACMVAITAGELLNAPAQQSAAAARARPEATGRVLGLLGFTMVLGRSLGPLAGGAVRDAFGAEPHATWGLIGSLGALAALLYAVPAPPPRAPASPERPGALPMATAAPPGA